MLTVKNSFLPQFSKFFSEDWTPMKNDFKDLEAPSTNIRELEESFLVEVAAPGMKKENFRIALDADLLTISAEQKEEQEDQKENYIRKEFSFQSFKRTFSLDKNLIDAEAIEASYEDGILKLVLPKKEEAKVKAPRVIEIS